MHYSIQNDQIMLHYSGWTLPVRLDAIYSKALRFKFPPMERAREYKTIYSNPSGGVSKIAWFPQSLQIDGGTINTIKRLFSINKLAWGAERGLGYRFRCVCTHCCWKWNKIAASKLYTDVHFLTVRAKCETRMKTDNYFSQLIYIHFEEFLLIEDWLPLTAVK